MYNIKYQNTLNLISYNIFYRAWQDAWLRRNYANLLSSKRKKIIYGAQCVVCVCKRKFISSNGWVLAKSKCFLYCVAEYIGKYLFSLEVRVRKSIESTKVSGKKIYWSHWVGIHLVMLDKKPSYKNSYDR